MKETSWKPNAVVFCSCLVLAPLGNNHPLLPTVVIPSYHHDLQSFCQKCATGFGVASALMNNDMDYISLLIATGDGLLSQDLREIGIHERDTAKLRRMLFSYHPMDSIRLHARGLVQPFGKNDRQAEWKETNTMGELVASEAVDLEQGPKRLDEKAREAEAAVVLQRGVRR